MQAQHPQLRLQHLVQKAFAAADVNLKYALVTASDRPDLADYQSNGAFLAAKEAKANPRAVAEKIMAHLGNLKDFADVSIAGPGFLNFRLHAHVFTDYLKSWNPAITVPQASQKVIVDYGGMNVAKPMHIGHLRSSIIGESIKRLCKFVGHEVLGDIHLGDWGTQMGMLITEIEARNPHLPYFDPAFKGSYPKESPCTLDDLQEMYPVISQKCKDDPVIAEKARLATVDLQQGRPGYRALWQHFVDVSIEDMKIQLKKLDVDFDQWFGESRYQDHIPALLDRLMAKGIVEESKGALIIPVAEPTDKMEIPPLMLRKSDGGYLYGTSDMGTIQERIDVFKAQLMIYVVDGRQGLHFEQVFRAARKARFNAQYEFIGFGTMNGPDNKPFKTRAGGVMRLEELIDQLVTEAQNRMKEAGLAMDLETAQQIGMAALKFADLQHDPIQNYQFDIQKFIQFEGKTGPYLLYAAVRIKSILAKATEMNLSASSTLADPQNDVERGLQLILSRYLEYILRAYDRRAPNVLCEFAYELAQQFSRFYSHCPILKEPDAFTAPRLRLCELTLQQLETVLELLGIKIPERM